MRMANKFLRFTGMIQFSHRLKTLPSIPNTSSVSTSSVLRMSRMSISNPPPLSMRMAGVIRSLHQAQQGLCSILELEEHRVMMKELGKEEVVDVMAKHILEENITVMTVALKCNLSVVKKPGQVTPIPRSDFPKDLDKAIKVGKFTIADDELIQRNWDNLIVETGITQEDAIRNLFEIEQKDKVIGLKCNLIGYYLAQGLPDIRLATEVIHRARIILCARKGKFNSDEDRTIIQFVEEKGKKWLELARLLARTQPTALSRRYEVLTGGNTLRGPYTMEEDKIILREVFTVNRDILEDGTITEEDWKMIGGKLERYSRNVYLHWNVVLKPMLLRHHAGIVNVDIREALINYLVEKNMKYAQDVDWVEVAKLPEFACTTPAYLRFKYQNMQTHTGRKYERMSKAELTSDAMQSCMGEREANNLDSYNEEQKEKKEKYQRELINFYLSNIVGGK